MVLVGDTITEEALPTYESWLLDIDGIHQNPDNGWAKWERTWTAEENRHGDVLNKYLYLSGRVNMREVEISTQHLITDGFDLGTSSDPYKSFFIPVFKNWPPIFRTTMLLRLHVRKGIKLWQKCQELLQGMKCAIIKPIPNL